jgi:hypothetical protein
MENIEDEEQSEQIKATKPKRQLTQAQLDQLAKAREKANAVRKQNAEMKKKAQRLKELQRQVHEEELDEEIERYSAGQQTKAACAPRLRAGETPSKPKVSKVVPSKAKPKRRSQRPTPAPVESSEESSEESEDEETSSSSEEEEPPPARKPKKQKKRPASRAAPYQQPAIQDVYAHQMNRAFGSLFPNYNVQ